MFLKAHTRHYLQAAFLDSSVLLRDALYLAISHLITYMKPVPAQEVPTGPL